jgi:hypothetical protein
MLVTPFLALAKRGEAGGELAMERGRRWRLVLDGSELWPGRRHVRGWGWKGVGDEKLGAFYRTGWWKGR